MDKRAEALRKDSGVFLMLTSPLAWKSGSWILTGEAAQASYATFCVLQSPCCSEPAFFLEYGHMDRQM